MPKSIDKLVGQLEELYKKIEYEVEDFGGCADDSLNLLHESIESLIAVSNELDSDLEEE